MNEYENAADQVSLRMAEEIVATWRSMDTSPRRAQLKATIKVAIGRAITEALIITTNDELNGYKDG
jgi:hypothetical protein